MKLLSLVCWLSLSLSVCYQFESDAAKYLNRAAGPPFYGTAQCLSDAELDKKLLIFKSQFAGPDLVEAKKLFLTHATRSQDCRQRVIQSLITAMGQHTSSSPDSETYTLWHNGATVLAELRADEALDLLIANLGLTDGLSTSLSHYPAVNAVTRIGQSAIPKLENLLAQDSDPNIRRLAVFCVASIGGSRARTALTNAVAKQSDQCTTRFMRISLEMFANKTRPNHVPPGKENARWFSAFYCLDE